MTECHNNRKKNKKPAICPKVRALVSLLIDCIGLICLNCLWFGPVDSGKDFPDAKGYEVLDSIVISFSFYLEIYRAGITKKPRSHSHVKI